MADVPKRRDHLRLVKADPDRDRLDAIRRKYGDHHRNPKAAELALDAENAPVLALALARQLVVDADVLGTPGTKNTRHEEDAARARVLRAWTAYHSPDQMRPARQRAIVEALTFVRENAAIWESSTSARKLRREMFRYRVERYDPAVARPASDSMIDAAIDTWPVRTGRPRGAGAAADAGPWERLNSLFCALGCGYSAGNALRAELRAAGIYPVKKP
jgi:hypothetical protein